MDADDRNHLVEREGDVVGRRCRSADAGVAQQAAAHSRQRGRQRSGHTARGPARRVSYLLSLGLVRGRSVPVLALSRSMASRRIILMACTVWLLALFAALPRAAQT